MFFDLGIGIIVSALASKYLGMPMDYVLVFGSILLAVFPDVDFIMVLLEYGYVGKYSHNHRHLFHFPLIYLFFFGLLVWLFFGINWILIFLVVSIIHFLHDGIGIGWGVPYFFPFSRTNYKFFTAKDNKFSSKFINSWSQEELAEAVEKFGEENWFRKYYLRLSPIFAVEMLVFVISAIILLRYLNLI